MWYTLFFQCFLLFFSSAFTSSLLANSKPKTQNRIIQPFRSDQVHLRSEDATTYVYRALAREAFNYLNRFRQQPVFYGSKLGLDFRKLKTGRSLSWNPILTAAAEKKAIDMASENYFGHIDPDGYGMNTRAYEMGYVLPEEWVSSKGKNYIESIAANNYNRDNFINQLILEKNVGSFGHREQLLGLTGFYSKASQIGIAIVYNKDSTYKYYCCILIAPLFAASDIEPE